MKRADAGDLAVERERVRVSVRPALHVRGQHLRRDRAEGDAVAAVAEREQHALVAFGMRTDRGDVRAHHVIVACGYEADRFLPEPVCTLHSTFALATDPLPAADLPPKRALVWETARPYYYLRTGESHRVIIGGADEAYRDPARRDAALATKWKLLLARAKRWLPGRALVPAHAWAGVFGQTRDGLAYIGPHPQLDPRIAFALGYGGNGITFSAVAAEVIAARIAGRRHRHADTFALDR